jgi:hypothetical protein
MTSIEKLREQVSQTISVLGHPTELSGDCYWRGFVFRLYLDRTQNPKCPYRLAEWAEEDAIAPDVVATEVAEPLYNELPGLYKSTLIRAAFRAIVHENFEFERYGKELYDRDSFFDAGRRLGYSPLTIVNMIRDDTTYEWRIEDDEELVRWAAERIRNTGIPAISAERKQEEEAISIMAKVLIRIQGVSEYRVKNEHGTIGAVAEVAETDNASAYVALTLRDGYVSAQVHVSRPPGDLGDYSTMPHFESVEERFPLNTSDNHRVGLDNVALENLNNHVAFAKQLLGVSDGQSG